MRPVIGVFDSGFGGLTVLRELLAVVPGADYLYFGDTARLPYGSKSAHTVAKYAISSAHFLQQRGAEILVIACNTAPPGHRRGRAWRTKGHRNFQNQKGCSHCHRSYGCQSCLREGASSARHSIAGEGLPSFGATGRRRMDRPSSHRAGRSHLH